MLSVRTLALTQISHHALYGVSPRDPSGLAVLGSWSFAGCFAAFWAGWSRSFSCSSISRVRFLSCSFAAWLEARSSLLLITGGTFCALELWHVFRVQDVHTVPVDNVEAFSFVQNFRTFLDCCSVSDDLSAAFPITVLPKDDHIDSVQEEQLDLRYWTMILAICVVVDESKRLDTPILEFSIICEHLPFLLGYKPILRLLLVHRNLAIWR